MMNPSVSVIIPVYNIEKFLSACLDSVCSQTLKDIEIICVDDGSTDSSLAILHRYKKQDERVIVLTQQNQGAGAARNYGLSIAKGEYLAFLDSDDFFEPDLLEKLYREAKKTQAEIVVCRADRYDNGTAEYMKIPWSIKEHLLPDFKPFSSKDIKKNFFEAFVWWPWDKLYKKSYIDSLGIQYQQLRTTNDLFFVCAAVLMAPNISYINDVLVHQRVSLKSSLSVTREKSWDNFYKALIALRDYLKKQGLYERFEQDFINYCLNFSFWHLETIHGEGYFLLYNALKEKWFDDLGILKHQKEYFYQAHNYENALSIMNTDITHHLRERVEQREKEILMLRRRTSELQSEIDCLKKSRSFRIGRFITYIPRMLKSK